MSSMQRYPHINAEIGVFEPSVCWMFGVLGVLGVRPSTRCCTSEMNE
jgi:hypothetical protein